MLEYKFNDKSLYQRAVTHSSASENNYERMEFLGDSILNFVVGEYLFENSKENEGKLTKVRAAFVAQKKLIEVFEKLNISEDIVIGKCFQGEVSKAVKADIVEAIIAGIYLDGGLIEAKNFIIKNFDLNEFESIEDEDYKSRLQESVQAEFRCTVKYKTTATNDCFVSEVYLGDDSVSKAKGHSKQEAEIEAAKIALKKLFE